MITVVTAARVHFRNVSGIDKKITSTIPAFTSATASTTAPPGTVYGSREQRPKGTTNARGRIVDERGRYRRGDRYPVSLRCCTAFPANKRVMRDKRAATFSLAAGPRERERERIDDRLQGGRLGGRDAPKAPGGAPAPVRVGPAGAPLGALDRARPIRRLP